MVKVAATTPTCVNGHGELVRVPHLWGLSGYNDVEADATYFPKPNGSQFLVTVWVCMQCGLVQLYDPDIGV